jgi:hypothetical protein
MAPKTKQPKQNNERQPPQGITEQDWGKTPVAVQKFVNSTLASNQKDEVKSGNYVPTWPSWVMLLVNLVLAFGLSLLFANRVVFQCVTVRQASEWFAAVILLVVFHLVWRAIHIPNPTDIKENIDLGPITIPITVLITFLNEIHPWKISSRLLVLFLAIFSAIGLFLNLSPYSPLYKGGQLLAIPSFTVQRLDSPSPEQIPPGGTLTINAGEKVFIKLALLGETQVSCTWFTTSSSGNVGEDCSILLDTPLPIKRDILTVFMQPACGSRQEPASLNVVVQP